MRNIQEVFNKINEIKQEQKKIRDTYKDALSHSKEHQEVKEEFDKIKENKKQIEGNMKAEFGREMDRMERLKQDLQDEQQLLSDIAMTQYTEGKSIELKDSRDNIYEPIFSVKFKKAE